jgi:hypothetical protein
MRGFRLRDVVLFLCVVVVIAPGNCYRYRLSDALKLKSVSAQYGQHLHPSRERAEKLQASLWQQTKAVAAEEGRLRGKV